MQVVFTQCMMEPINCFSILSPVQPPTLSCLVFSRSPLLLRIMQVSGTKPSAVDICLKRQLYCMVT